jgi:hypothetical protein
LNQPRSLPKGEASRRSRRRVAMERGIRKRRCSMGSTTASTPLRAASRRLPRGAPRQCGRGRAVKAKLKVAAEAGGEPGIGRLSVYTRLAW